MIKLYKKEGKKLLYHEAWCDGAAVVEHWGEIGKKGKSKKHKANWNIGEKDRLKKVLASAYDRGFAEVDIDDHAVLVVEYKLNNWGSEDDLEKRHALEDELNEILGWTGLGMCDGGSIGSGTMEVFCYVVDYRVAEDVVKKELKGTKYGDFSRIYSDEI